MNLLVNSIGEPDAANLHVRFDELGAETERWSGLRHRRWAKAAGHSTVVEVFVPLSGRWKFNWGEDGKGEAELGPWDTISFPAGLMEGFRNISAEEGTLLVILGGPDVGEIIFRKNEEQPAA